ncbi:MAG: hypothetical protein M2R45_04850 [Verrucomicrobia subdivision 3 bacterium]|nr:hypothetical protein [Limisphaerales bacterium]MCS1417543.1 hypothetical protein [Limisphaerales bacterium]
MAAGGLSLSQLLRMEAKASIGKSHKAIINIYLPSGPSHIDTFDLKPNAPSEVRGEFNPIKTNVQGMEICELFPDWRRWPTNLPSSDQLQIRMVEMIVTNA